MSIRYSIYPVSYILPINIYAFWGQTFCRSNSTNYFCPQEIARTMQVKMNDLTHWIYLIITLHETRTGQYFTMSENTERVESSWIIKIIKTGFSFPVNRLKMHNCLLSVLLKCHSSQEIRFTPCAPWELLFNRLGSRLLN